MAYSVGPNPDIGKSAIDLAKISRLLLEDEIEYGLRNVVVK
jgi:hypothetical protein